VLTIDELQWSIHKQEAIMFVCTMNEMRTIFNILIDLILLRPIFFKHNSSRCMSHDFNVPTSAGFLLSFWPCGGEYASISVDSAASVFRVDTVNQHAAQKSKRLINHRSGNLKTYIWQLAYP